MRDVHVHHRGMAGDCGRQFDSELIVGRLKVVVAEVENSDAGVPVECVDDVATCLEADLAVGDV